MSIEINEQIEDIETFVSKLIQLDIHYEKTNDFRYWQRHDDLNDTLREFMRKNPLAAHVYKLYQLNPHFHNALRDQTKEQTLSYLEIDALVNEYL